MNPQEVTNSTLSWITAATAIIGGITTLATYAVGKFRELQSQIEAQKNVSTSHTIQLSSQQQQIAAIGLATPAPSQVANQTPAQ